MSRPRYHLQAALTDLRLEQDTILLLDSALHVSNQRSKVRSRCILAVEQVVGMHFRHTGTPDAVPFEPSRVNQLASADFAAWIPKDTACRPQVNWLRCPPPACKCSTLSLDSNSLLVLPLVTLQSR